MSLALVLVEPAGPLNVGSVARLCANFGLDELRLVAPRCDPAGEEARRMAVHGGALLERARRFPDLAAALADCHRVVATSGRVEQEALPLCGASEALHWLLAGQQGPPAQGCWGALVFGREDRGLSNDELLQAGRVLRLDTGAAYSSLNLSHAVAICLHELQQLRQNPAEPAAQGAADPAVDPCARAALEATLADAEALLLQVGFLYPHTAHARMAKLRALLQRALVREPELALLRGMVRQLRWAAERRTP
ncbi:MAG: RNA methyltransferase [Vulcanococcus sp.]